MSACRGCQDAEQPAPGARVYLHRGERYPEAWRDGTSTVLGPAPDRNGHRFVRLERDDRPGVDLDPWALCDVAPAGVTR